MTMLILHLANHKILCHILSDLILRAPLGESQGRSVPQIFALKQTEVQRGCHLPTAGE